MKSGPIFANTVNFRRTLTSILLMPPVLLVVYVGGLPLTGIIAVAAAIAVWEVNRICVSAGYPFPLVIGLLITLSFVLSAYFGIQNTEPILLVAVLTCAFWVPWNNIGEGRPLANWALALTAGLYAGGLMRYGVLLRGLPEGLQWCILTLLGTWSYDTSAFIIGRRFGKHPMALHISPKKTWEGAIGGACISFSVLALASAVLMSHALQLLPLGLLIPIAVQCGDLTASMMKRSAGVKDFSNLIPGHGGLLDRIDGLLFAAVVTFYYATWIVVK